MLFNFCKIGSSLNSQFPFKSNQHVCQKHDQQRLLTHSKETKIYMLNEKLQIMIDKETIKDVLVLHEKTCDKYGIPFNPSWNSKNQLYSNGGNTHK